MRGTRKEQRPGADPPQVRVRVKRVGDLVLRVEVQASYDGSNWTVADSASLRVPDWRKARR